MPQVTVIPSDTTIIVDGEVIHCPFEAPATLHAVQWDGKKGHIEYTDGKLNKPLSGEADYLTHVLPYVDLWKAEKKRLEAEQPQYEEPTLAEVSATKYAEIINGANAALKEAQAYYSAIEIGTWSEQETGAIAIKGLDASVATKPEVAIMLSDSVAVEKSKERVKGIAINKGMTSEELADRILHNAQTAKTLIDRILTRQNCYEKQLQDFSVVKDGETEADVIGWIEAMVIDYSADAGSCDGE